jgi:hypothetical protein
MHLESNIVISNVIQCADENTLQLAETILEKVNCGYTNIKQEILGAYRMKPRRTTDTPALLIKLGSAAVKKMIFKVLKENNVRIYCDEIGLSIKQQIYFNHHLTSVNQKLLGMARQVKKSCNFYSAYYSNGFIWMKRTETAAPLKIEHEDDIPK